MAYAHIKDDKEIKLESLENKCDKLELDITNLKNSKDLRGKEILRLKREVEDVLVLCNIMFKYHRNSNKWKEGCWIQDEPLNSKK